jgi:hypothetical protein
MHPKGIFLGYLFKITTGRQKRLSNPQGRSPA